MCSVAWRRAVSDGRKQNTSSGSGDPSHVRRETGTLFRIRHQLQEKELLTNNRISTIENLLRPWPTVGLAWWSLSSTRLILRQLLLVVSTSALAVPLEVCLSLTSLTYNSEFTQSWLGRLAKDRIMRPIVTEVFAGLLSAACAAHLCFEGSLKTSTTLELLHQDT